MQQQATPPPDEDDVAPSSMTTADDNWTAQLPQTEHVRFFCTTDWARTELGPLEGWSATLRLFAGFVLADSRAACLWWGPNLTAIYNEAYAPLAAQLHPMLMGSTFQLGYPDLFPHIGTYFDECRRTGAGVNYSSAVPLVVERKGWQEEAFFSGSFTPIGPVGQPSGFYNSTFEVTTQKISDRRTSLLNKLAAVPNSAVDAAFTHILTTLGTDPHDIPLAMLYKFEADVGPSPLQLVGQFGLPEGHELLVESAYIDSEAGVIPDMRRAGSEAMMIPYDARFDAVSWKGWGIPPTQIAVLPLTSGARLFGYLVCGTNPCRPHDELCQQFGRDLNRMVSSIITSAVDHESTKQRQEQLEADLAFSDLKLRHLIDHASVGMCHVSLDGQMLWANDHYYHLGGMSAEDQAPRYAFFDVYHDDDRQKAVEVFEKLLVGEDHHITAEFRLKRSFQAPTGESEPAHIQVLAFPYRDPYTGQVKSVMACTTDISRLKWAQTFEARLAAEAREAKRQQEAFIDVVSHEMRNPLSAIVHCADAITSSMDEVELTNLSVECLDALQENVQSAKIILQCANHQKRIIDDILTLSKLDSMLLSITPVAVKIPKLVDSIVSIFEAEMKSHGIQYNVKSDTSLTSLRISRLYLDPSRVTQVFINLLTNAIKFVKSSQAPLISIRYGASLSDPRAFFPESMFWANDNNQDSDVTNSPEWGHGEEVFLTFTVQDSGIGLQDKEIHKIFERFRQANVKTHIKYGGSGLGLFISKNLTEKQGGEIGVSSQAGRGSTFGFYVKTRRVEHRPKLDTSMRSGSHQGPARPQLRVLLVEDNLINQEVLSRQLRRASCTVTVANHGQEALAVLEEHTFDVVLMDLEMPVLDGLAATSMIRKKELAGEGLLGQAMADTSPRAGAQLPIIVVTANVRKEQIDTAIAAGADRVMQKPFKAGDLVYMMKSLLPDTAPSNIDPPTPGLAIRSNGLIA